MRVLRRARLVFRQGHSAIDCVILDLSDGGARIRLSGLLAVPRAFELRLDTGVTYPASVCYRQPDAAGVRFLEAS